MSVCQTCQRRPAAVVHDVSGHRACEPCALAGPELAAQLTDVDAKVLSALLGNNRPDRLSTMRKMLHDAVAGEDSGGQESLKEYNAFADAFVLAIKGDCGGARMPLVNARWSKRVNAGLAVQAALAMAREHSEARNRADPTDDAKQNAEARAIVAAHASTLMEAMSSHCTSYWARAMLADTFGPLDKFPEWIPVAVRDEITAPAKTLRFADQSASGAAAAGIGDELEDIGAWRGGNPAGGAELTRAFAALLDYAASPFSGPSGVNYYDQTQSRVAANLAAQFGANRMVILQALAAATASLGGVRPRNRRASQDLTKYRANVAIGSTGDVERALTAGFAKLFAKVLKRKGNVNVFVERIQEVYKRLAAQLQSVRRVVDPIGKAAQVITEMLDAISAALGGSAAPRPLYGGYAPQQPPASYRPLAYMGDEIDDIGADLEDIGVDLEDIDANWWQRAKGIVTTKVGGRGYRDDILADQVIALSSKALTTSSQFGSTIGDAIQPWLGAVVVGVRSKVVDRESIGMSASTVFSRLIETFNQGGTPAHTDVGRVDVGTFAKKWTPKFKDTVLAEQLADMYFYVISGQRAAKETYEDRLRTVVSSIQSVYRRLVRELRTVNMKFPNGATAADVAYSVIGIMLQSVVSYLQNPLATKTTMGGAPAPPPRE